MNIDRPSGPPNIRCNGPSDDTPRHCRLVWKDCVTQIMKQSLKEMKLEYIFEMHSFSTDLEDESVHRTNHSQQRKNDAAPIRNECVL